MPEQAAANIGQELHSSAGIGLAQKIVQFLQISNVLAFVGPASSRSSSVVTFATLGYGRTALSGSMSTTCLQSIEIDTLGL